MNKICFIIRGLPGSGKSTTAHSMGFRYGVDLFETDEYFTAPNGCYRFRLEEMPDAIKDCADRFMAAVDEGWPRVCVTGVFTFPAHFNFYQTYAYRKGYRLHVITVNHTPTTQSIHDVPTDVYERMKKTFQPHLVS